MWTSQQLDTVHELVDATTNVVNDPSLYPSHAYDVQLAIESIKDSLPKGCVPRGMLILAIGDLRRKQYEEARTRMIEAFGRI